MRKYGRIHCSFWTSKTIKGLSDDAKYLAVYLLTCEHNTAIGAFRLPLAYACDDLGWVSERFKKAFKALEDASFAVYCRETQWVCIIKFLEWNPAENPNQQKAVNKALLALPDTCFLEGLRNGCVTVSKQEAKAKTKEEAKENETVSVSKPCTFSKWIETIPADADAIPLDHHVFSYADGVKLPREYLALAWARFEKYYSVGNGKAKKYKSWPDHFRTAVEDGYGGLWGIAQDGSYYLTTAGKQLQLEVKA